MTAERGATPSGKSKCLAARRVEIAAAKAARHRQSGWLLRSNAAWQDAQLPRLTVHWLSVTRATEGPLSKISGPYFELGKASLRGLAFIVVSRCAPRSYRGGVQWCKMRQRDVGFNVLGVTCNAAEAVLRDVLLV
jgi:hypothetical protein